MAGALREMFAFLSVQVDDKAVDQTNKKLEEFTKTAKKVGQNLAAAFGAKAIYSFIEGQLEAGAELAHTAEMLGMTTEQMERFDYAASTMGISTEEASNSLRFLNRNIGEAATKGGDGAAAFAKLGVHLKDANGQIRPTSDVLGDVADGFTKLGSPAEKTAVSMQLFGRAGARMIPFLNDGSAGVAKLNKEFDTLGGGMSKKFVQSSLKAEHEMAKLHLVSDGLKSEIAGALAPAFTYVIEKATSAVAWFRELNTHSNFLKTALEGLGVVVTGLAGYWALMNLPLILAVAGFIFAIAVIDDVKTALEGGKSVIGDFIDSVLGLGATKAMWEQLNDWVDEAAARFARTVDQLKEIRLNVREVADTIAHAMHLESDDEYAKRTAKNEADRAGVHADEDKQTATVQRVISAPSVFDKIDANENAAARMQDPNGPNQSKFKLWDATNHFGAGPGDWGFNPQQATIAPPPGAAAHGPVTNHVTNNANVTQTFNGQTDPKAAGKATADAARKALQDTWEDAFAASPTGGGH